MLKFLFVCGFVICVGFYAAFPDEPMLVALTAFVITLLALAAYYLD